MQKVQKLSEKKYIIYLFICFYVCQKKCHNWLSIFFFLVTFTVGIVLNTWIIHLFYQNHSQTLYFQVWWATSIGAHLALITFVCIQPEKDEMAVSVQRWKLRLQLMHKGEKTHFELSHCCLQRDRRKELVPPCRTAIDSEHGRAAKQWKTISCTEYGFENKTKTSFSILADRCSNCLTYLQSYCQNKMYCNVFWWELVRVANSVIFLSLLLFDLCKYSFCSAERA